MKRAFLLPFMAAIVLLPSCGTARLSQEDLTPTEEETETESSLIQKKIGFVKAVEIQPESGATHVLLSALEDGTLILLLVSDQVSLAMYEEQEVEVEGMVQVASGTGPALMRVLNIVSVTQAKQEDVVSAVKSLAPLYTPPLVIAATDTLTVTQQSASAGTATVEVVHEGKTYVVKLVRKPDPKIGQWTIFDLGEQGALTKDEDKASDDEGESTDEETESELTEDAPVTVKTAEGTLETDPERVSIITYLANNLATVLGSSVTGQATPTKFSFTSTNNVYVEYMVGGEEGMLLLTYSGSGGTYTTTTEATFKVGASADWEKVSGTNSQKGQPVTIYKSQGGSWVAVAEINAGNQLFENRSTGYSIQVPLHWYYWNQSAASRVLFSDQAVEETNALLEVKVLSGNLSTELGIDSGATSEGTVTVGTTSGTKRTYADGSTKIFLPKSGGGTFMFRAPGGQESTLMDIVGSLDDQL